MGEKFSFSKVYFWIFHHRFCFKNALKPRSGLSCNLFLSEFSSWLKSLACFSSISCLFSHILGEGKIKLLLLCYKLPKSPFVLFKKITIIYVSSMLNSKSFLHCHLQYGVWGDSLGFCCFKKLCTTQSHTRFKLLSFLPLSNCSNFFHWDYKTT